MATTTLPLRDNSDKIRDTSLAMLESKPSISREDKGRKAR